METRSSNWATEAAAVFTKDYTAEMRTRYALGALLLFALTALAVVSFTIGPAALDEGILAALLWMVIFFAAMNGLARTFVREEETGTVIALRLSASPQAVFLGKLTVNLALLLGLEAVIVPLFTVLLNLKVGNRLLLLLILGIGSLGLAGGATLVAAIVAKTSSRGTLFAVLSFPVLFPLLVTAVRGTRLALQGVSLAATGGELRMLVSYSGIIIIAGLFLFGYIWDT
jgi:heme exporter protein B